MARHSFAPIDALLALACTVIFAGGVLAQVGGRDLAAPPRIDPPYEKIATDLGIPADRVREAFHKVGPPPRTGQPPTDAQLKAHAQALANAINISPDKLRPVLEKYRPEPPPQRGGASEGRS
ncbi:MAG: hypothetical protein Q8K93_27155 [Reyranella sp.]|uniref:hypothetical protein n=1 Tax=Reyranella sp. TaxID=1929291 RepID=UPI002731ED79|nr:hypothetical protein [Reyranella sp.]MDP1965872.1 hypothetical protein [Reyranella sp.]MDP2373733.1 hypothetical protein [Reyranella sp.]